MAIDVRPNLLYGDLDTILMSNLKQVRSEKTVPRPFICLAKSRPSGPFASRACNQAPSPLNCPIRRGTHRSAT